MSLRKFGLLTSIALAHFGMPAARAQDGQETNPAAALTSALMGACRQNEPQFAHYLTVENAAAFLALPADQRSALLKRLVLLDEPGRPLISTGTEGHTVLRCESAGMTVEMRFGQERVHENLAFVPLLVVDGRTTEFGMVREGGGWRILSLGLLLFNIPELSKQWAEQDLEAREAAVIATIRGLAEAIGTYRRAFGKLPESLAQLGPAPKDGVSPDAANLIGEDLAGGSRGGYHYRFRIVPEHQDREATFELAASPAEYGKNGRRSFFLDGTGKIHAVDKQGAAATGEDPLLTSEKRD